MEHDEKLIVCKRMRLRGGSFARALAEAMMRADPINLKKIEKAFPELLKEYKEW